MFSGREVIEWRKLSSRTCALGGSNIADFNRRQPFLRILGSRVHDLFPQARGCSPKRSSENGPRQRTARRRSWTITRARVGGPSRNRACSYWRASTSLARRHPELVSLFRGSMAGLQAPLSTLPSRTSRCATHDSGQSGLLFLSCQRLSLFTLCRSPGALAYFIFRNAEYNKMWSTSDGCSLDGAFRGFYSAFS